MEPSIVAWLMVPAPIGRTCSSRGSEKLKCWSERQACVGPGCGMADSTVNGRFASASTSCARLQIPVCIGRAILRRQRIFTRRFTFLFANPPVILGFSPSDLVAPCRHGPREGFGLFLRNRFGKREAWLFSTCRFCRLFLLQERSVADYAVMRHNFIAARRRRAAQ